MRRHFREDRAATDPILVIAAIAVSLVLLVGGGFAVSGLVGNAHDSNAKQDVGRVATAERMRAADGGAFSDSFAELNAAGAKAQLSDGVRAGVLAGTDCFAAFTKAPTGTVYTATSSRAAPTAVATPWPATAPGSWPAGCSWPATEAEAMSSRVTNQVTNPVGALPGDGSTAVLGTAFGPATLRQATGVPVPSGRGIAVVPTSGNGDNALTFGDETPERDVFRLGMQAGHTYTISGSLYLQAPQAGPTYAGRARGITVFTTGAYFSEVNSEQAPNTAGVHHVAMTVTIPKEASDSFVRFYNGSTNTADVAVWTEMMVTEGTADYAFGSGDTTGWSWTGTPNRSPSTGRTTMR
ncbi:hypothetical protein ACWGJ9_11340 [Curtobacterium citreum]